MIASFLARRFGAPLLKVLPLTHRTSQRQKLGSSPKRAGGFLVPFSTKKKEPALGAEPPPLQNTKAAGTLWFRRLKNSADHQRIYSVPPGTQIYHPGTHGASRILFLRGHSGSYRNHSIAAAPQTVPGTTAVAYGVYINEAQTADLFYIAYLYFCSHTPCHSRYILSIN